jgi:hypothetical protein
MSLDRPSGTDSLQRSGTRERMPERRFSDGCKSARSIFIPADPD